MRPPIMPVQLLAASVDQDRHRGEPERHARHRAAVATWVERPSLPARLGAATLRAVRRDRHALTSYPCRLADGKIGRTAVIVSGGDWTLVCRVA